MDLPGFGFHPILLILQLSIFILPVVSWIVLYVKGAEARDLLFWGVIVVVIPILGPLAAIIYALRSNRGKQKRLSVEQMT